MDWLLIWGVAQAAGFLFKPILEELATDAAKDYVKDFFKDCLKRVLHLPEGDPLQQDLKEAYGKAIKEFLGLVQQELEDADYEPALIRQYLAALTQFVKAPTVVPILSHAFAANCLQLDSRLLLQAWEQLNPPVLPDSFNWDQVSRRYLRKVRAIVQESDGLRPIFTAALQAAAVDQARDQTELSPDFDLGRYATSLSEQYGHLRLDALASDGMAYRLPLWQIFIPQQARECWNWPEPPRNLSAEENSEAISELIPEPISVLQLLAPDSAPAKTVILGNPGSGKSSLLQYLAVTWARQPLRDLPNLPLPLLIELHRYAQMLAAHQTGGPNFLTFMHQNAIGRLNQHQLQQKLQSGAMLLLDGLDEIFDPLLREAVLSQIHRFTLEYPQVQVIVTSRELGYRPQRLRQAGFRHFRLQDLADAQILEFIQRWHQLPGLERLRQRLQTAVFDSPIRELAGNPLLLTLMAILNRHQELPRDRAELYHQASRVLLHQWDAEAKVLEDPDLDRFNLALDYRDKQAVLRQVAYQMQTDGSDSISHSQLEALLGDYLNSIAPNTARAVARLLLRALQERNFMLHPLPPDRYSFVHRSFLEYFCAWEIVWQFKETQQIGSDQLRDLFDKHWHDSTWHEILRLICGLLEAQFVGPLIECLRVQDGESSQFANLFLAARCLGEVRNRARLDQNSTLLAQIQGLIHYQEPLEGFQAKFQAKFQAEFQAEFRAEFRADSQASLQPDQPDQPDILFFDESMLLARQVRTQAVQTVAAVWPHLPQTQSWLQFQAEHHLDADLREVARTVLSQLQKPLMISIS